jgi:hypothetical protein
MSEPTPEPITTEWDPGHTVVELEPGVIFETN